MNFRNYFSSRTVCNLTFKFGNLKLMTAVMTSALHGKSQLDSLTVNISGNISIGGTESVDFFQGPHERICSTKC